MRIIVENPGVVAELRQWREEVVPLLKRIAEAAEIIAGELKPEPTPADLQLKIDQQHKELSS